MSVNHTPNIIPDFPLGASSTLFERWRRIFGHFFRSSLQIARYLRLIHVKTASKSASTIVSNPNRNSGFKLCCNPSSLRFISNRQRILKRMYDVFRCISVDGAINELFEPCELCEPDMQLSDDFKHGSANGGRYDAQCGDGFCW